jgi:hypothetical protein
LAKLGTEFGSPIVMDVVAAVVLLAGPDALADGELLELLLQPDMTADAITTPATQPGSTSVRLI